MGKTKYLKKFMAATLSLSMLSGTALTAMPTEQVKAADTAESQWDKIQSVVSRYYGEWKDTSYSGLISNQMPNTALLGNGDVGVASGGNAKEKTFYVSKGDFWTYNEGQIALGGVTIREKEKQETDTNLALNYKSATASSVHEQFAPENAVNGTMTDANDMWCTQIGKEHWLQLEFDTPITFSRWVLKFDEALRPGLPDISANTASDFQLQISEDGQTWTDVSNIKGNTDAVFDENLTEAVTAKYVRVYFTKPTQETTADSQQNPRARVAEFELYANAKYHEEGEENLALNKTVEVSSQWAGEAKGTLVDGNDGTQWTTSTDSRNAQEHWAIIDLGEERTIGYWMLKNSLEKDCATSDFQLQYSNDKTEWIDFATVKGNTETTVTGTLDTPVSARYIRLLITKGTQKDNEYARIKELELYENYVEPPEPFYEKQDILNAEIQTKQEIADVNTEMTTWLAADENVMVTELRSKSDKPAELEIETWASENASNIRPITAENDDTSVTVSRATQNSHPEDINSWTSKAALSTTVIGADIKDAASDSKAGKGSFSFTLQPNETVYVVTAIGGGGRTYTNEGRLWDGEVEPTEEAGQILSEVKDEAAIQELNQDRKDWWKDYWSASYVDFGTDDERLNQIQKYYYGAQYILGSTAKEGELAPGLYGVWRTNDTPGWDGDYHMNYNFIATFYGAASSNRADLVLPVTDVLYGHIAEGEEMASNVEELRNVTRNRGYNTGTDYPYYDETFIDNKIEEGKIDPENGIQDAILFPVGIGPWGSTTDIVTSNETLNAAYNSYMFTHYYDYTLDENILEPAYEFLKKCANFYEAWLVKEDGRYNLYAGWCETTWAKNPAVELAAVQNVFRNLISMSEILGVDEDKRPLWEEIYEDMSVKPTWEVNGKTVYGLAEKRLDAEADENGEGFTFWGSTYGNPVQLDYFIPGDSMGYFSTPEELEIARNTISMFDNGSGNILIQGINNFPRIFTYAVRARYDIDKLVDYFYGETVDGKMAPNLRIVDGNHGVEKCGGIEAVNSMLLQTDKGITKIFPNWCADKNAKFANLRAKGAFTVSAEYDGEAQEAKNVMITSEKGQSMTLVSPWAEGMTVKDSQGNIITTTKGTVSNWEDVENATYTFETTAGETYTVEKGETAAEKPSKNTLEFFLNKAKEHQANGDVDNCVESIKNLFAEAITEGEAVMADENATYDEVMDATIKLMKAIQALDMKAADKTDLEMAVELAESIDLTKYVEAGQAEFQQALAAAQEVLADGDAMQADTDAAWNALVDAISNLRLKADKSTLEDLLNSVADLDLSQYTEESAAVFRTALANAQAVLADETLSEDDQKTVDEAVQALSDAKDQLQFKDASTGDGNENTGDGSDNAGNGDGNTGNGDSQTPGNGDNSGNNGNSGNSNAGNSKTKAAKTGDTAMPFAMLALAAAAGVVAVVSVRKKQTR